MFEADGPQFSDVETFRKDEQPRMYHDSTMSKQRQLSRIVVPLVPPLGKIGKRFGTDIVQHHPVLGSLAHGVRYMVFHLGRA